MTIFKYVFWIIKPNAKISLSYTSAALFLGLLPLLYISKLPNIKIEIMLVLLITAFIVLFIVNSPLKFILIVWIAFIWGCWHSANLIEKMDLMSLGYHQVITTIVSVPIKNQDEQNVKVRIDKINGASIFPPIYANWYLSKQYKNKVCLGQKWFLTTNLKPIHGLLNEGGFNNQRNLISQRVIGNLKNRSALNLDSRCSLRQKIIDHYFDYINNKKSSGVIYALMFGERTLLERQQSEWLQKTGVSHLLAISGLHIGIAYFSGFFFFRLIQRLLPYAFFYVTSPLWGGLFIALTYGWLSGFSIPAIRAVLALLLGIYLRKQAFYCFAWQWAIGSMALILFVDPLAILSDSLWLSGFAVIAILYWCAMVPLSRIVDINWWLKWMKLLHLQIGLLLLLIPIQLSIFNGFNPASLLANLWLVPIVSFIVVPLVMVAFVLPTSSLQQLNLQLIDHILSFSLMPLPLLADYWFDLTSMPFWLWILSLSWIWVLVGLFGWFRYYYHLIACGLTLLLHNIYVKEEQEGWSLTMLDVGHGLAMIIEQQGRALIYDTGNSWHKGDIASSQIIPFLTKHKIQPLGIILSHNHLDHTGGVKSLKRRYPNIALRSSFGGHSHLPCHRGIGWQWGALFLNVLWPIKGLKLSHNDNSCVIQISDGYRTILLTGDVEKYGEKRMVALEREAISSEIIQVPHHGSNTSSTPLLLKSVAPDLALVSSARYSPWRIPSDKVRNRYKERKITWLNTSETGQITIWFNKEKKLISRYRYEIKPRWYHQWFGENRFP